MRIADIDILNPFSLAPMAGINSTAFRMLCKENHAGLIFTQMYDTNMLSRMSSDEAKQLLNIHEIEHPVVIQLIGRDQKKMNQAGRLIEKHCEMININAGCIEQDYLERGCGAALIKEPEKLCSLVRSLAASVSVPVTVKIRIGWDAQSLNAVLVCRMLEDAGARAIVIHGRTAEQKYAGKANWVIIRQAVQKTTIPIIGNGDIKSHGEGILRMEESGCAGVMVGREAKYCPWVFSGIAADNSTIQKQILRYIELYLGFEGRQSLDEVKDQVFRMSRDFRTKMDKRALKSLGSIDAVREYVLSW